LTEELGRWLEEAPRQARNDANLNEIRDGDRSKDQPPVDIGEALLVKANWSIGGLDEDSNFDSRQSQAGRPCPTGNLWRCGGAPLAADKTKPDTQGKSSQQQRNEKPTKRCGKAGTEKRQDKAGRLERDLNPGGDRLAKLWEHGVAL
jgi:hypothetical protein